MHGRRPLGKPANYHEFETPRENVGCQSISLRHSHARGAGIQHCPVPSPLSQRAARSCELDINVTTNCGSQALVTCEQSGIERFRQSDVDGVISREIVP